MITLVAVFLTLELPPGLQEFSDVQHQEHRSISDGTHRFLMQQASGTGIQPAAVPSPMAGHPWGQWTVMSHWQGYVSQVVQTGPRGEDALFSTNWFMGMADRPFGGGRVMFRSMLSLEPATVSDQYYPELFQTGETADGRPIIDGQHPHEFFMELSAQYVHEIATGTFVNLYLAAHGDPALGPIAFPHRVSSMEIPQATLGHHFQDATHIAGSVITGVVARGPLRLEASAFHGQEPDEDRWDLDLGPIDSWSARLSFAPTPHWMGQVSTARLNEPEALEEGDIDRTTASVTYFRPRDGGAVAASLIWGQNRKESHHLRLDSFGAEGLIQFFERNHLTGRLEVVDKDELLEDHHVFRIKALSLGFTRDVWLRPAYWAGVGGNVTLYDFPSELDQFYGGNPRSYYLFIRLRSSHAGVAAHH